MMLKASNVYRKIAIDATDAEGIAPTLPIPTKTFTDTAAQATKGTHSHPTKGKSINSAGRIQIMMLEGIKRL